MFGLNSGHHAFYSAISLRIWKLTRTKSSMIYIELVIWYLSQIEIRIFASLTLKQFFSSTLSLVLATFIICLIYIPGTTGYKKYKATNLTIKITRSVLIVFVIVYAIIFFFLNRSAFRNRETISKISVTHLCLCPEMKI